MASASMSLRDRRLYRTETADTRQAHPDTRQCRRRHRPRVQGGSERGVAMEPRHAVKTTASVRVRRSRLPARQNLLLLLLVTCVLRYRDHRQHQQQQQQQGSSAFMFGWGANAELRPEPDLTSNCLNFPARSFDPESSVEAVNGGNSPYLPMSEGQDAIDFTLHDLDGDEWNLRETLERTGLPVVMVWGMYTCPAFQGYGNGSPWDQCGYWNERDLVEDYKDRATFVHLYGPEPHPSTPGTNFDNGSVWQMYWSDSSQPRSYEDRRTMAGRISGLIHPDQALLVDYLPGNPYSKLIQPVWCSYGMGARPVVMISPDGKVFFQRAWFFAGHVAGAIDEYWCQQEQEQQGERREVKSGVLVAEQGETGSEGGERPGSASGGWCRTTSSDEEDHGDTGEPGIPPLAGVLSGGKSEASSPPWWP